MTLGINSYKNIGPQIKRKPGKRMKFGRLLMMDVDDDGFKIYTASRLNKARGLTKGRAAPCKIIKAIKHKENMTQLNQGFSIKKVVE